MRSTVQMILCVGLTFTGVLVVAAGERVVAARSSALACSAEAAAQLALVEGRPRLAQRIYAELERADGCNVLAWRNNQACCLLDVGQLDEAADEFRTLIGEGYVPAEIGLGLVYVEYAKQHEDETKARADYTTALQCLAGTGNQELGFVLYALGRYDEAATTFASAARETGDLLFTYNLLSALEADGQAVDYGALASMADPDDAANGLILNALADQEESRGDSSAAFRIREQAHQFEPLEAR